MIEAFRELESDNCPTSRVYTRFHWLLNHPAYGSDDAPSEFQRSGILHELGVTRAEFNSAMYHVAGEKRRRSPATLRNIEEADPRDWWYSNKKDYPLVWEIAKRVFAIPPSSAASERAWNIMDFIHSKKHSRLATDKVDMLAYIYVHHHAVLKEGGDWARLHSYAESYEALERDVTEQ
ncbi:unnamed protein product [Phytophthora fragariaefolia]|uniref:Unnamed protein product n=1 Tax=Phytophthora fragariaefolia TaxID=1490495 RepID=A0A9W7CZA4_9STRA|nr:unnamed protein product [Phytophthora fragariaefolia]